MSEPKYAVTAVGNAIVDTIARVDDEFIKKFGMERNVMQLIDEARAVELYAAMSPEREIGGGSAANTMVGFASFGGKGAFIGKVADDKLGELFVNDIKSSGVHFNTQPLILGPATARSMIMVTPDAQRTMNTFLGASVELTPDDIDITLIGSSGITYLEGYLFDRDLAKRAFIKSAEVAHESGHRVALTLSDPFCVDRHREDFQNLVEHRVDVLFANEDEIKALYEEDQFEVAAKIVAGKCEVAALTRSEKGSVVVSHDKVMHTISPVETDVIDTTGAGDQYAAGFLYGFTEGMPLEQCGRLGSLSASEVISHVGPRPEIDYKALLPKLAA